LDDNTILLVEDSPDDEALTRRALVKNNILNKVVVAHDGEEALDYLFGTGAAGPDRHRLPQLVLLDLKLPRVDGHEVLSRLRADKRTKLLPVVVFTSSNEEQDILKSYSHGANSYICKPVDYARFSEAVCQLGSYWLSLNTSPRGGATLG
jgi:CheY-like chemotaxis protein